MHAHPSERYYPDLDGQVAVVDGYGVSLRVERGHLVIRDGIGQQRRERRLNRASTTITRVLILGHAGLVTLEALRWCLDVGIMVSQIDAASGLAGLLRDTPLRIADIATTVGYADAFHFSRVFHRVMGAAPRAWRQQR